MENPVQRTAIFISHATPQDNAFVRWLGAKLTALGYEVWADLFALRGGSDWSRDLEDALRYRAVKMLLVCTPEGLEKQGVRNEIEIAVAVAKSIGDSEFIIPLRLSPFEPIFRIAQAQYIDFTNGWAEGLTEVTELLSEKAIPRLPDHSQAMQQWLADQTSGSSTIVKRRERLFSNWLRFSTVPRSIHYCEPPAGFGIERFQRRPDHGWPLVPFHGGILTFARPNDSGELWRDTPARLVAERSFQSFFREGWDRLSIEPYQAVRMVSDLFNQAFDLYMHQRGLSAQVDANGRHSWWGDIKTAPKTKVRFGWRGVDGQRQIMGQSGKRQVFWHYGLNGQLRVYPNAHLRLSPRLVFTTNGLDAIEDPKKAHRLRRSFAKGWRNARWRDMLLAYLWWIADGRDELTIPVSDSDSLVTRLPPYSLDASFGIQERGGEGTDEDDPDVEYDYWDEEPESDNG